jgi:NAD(P)-dependent dehydrogenase (short-subunit alcohol dehydrogenase family)
MAGDRSAGSQTGRVVLITGATGAAGRAAATRFADDDARLGLVGTDEGRLTAMAEELGLPADRVATAVGDLRDPEAARGVVAAVVERLGPIDVVLHLVGGWAGGTPTTEEDPGVVADMLAQHLRTSFHIIQATVPAMAERGWGRVVAITASVTATPAPNLAAYAIAKSAEEALLRTVAREVGSKGVTVNLLAVRKIDAAHERETAPAARNAGWTTPEEIAATLAMLSSDDGTAINGARIALDGRA